MVTDNGAEVLTLPVALLTRLGGGRVGQAIAAARHATSRKVRTPQSKVVGNAHPG